MKIRKFLKESMTDDVLVKKFEKYLTDSVNEKVKLYISCASFYEGNNLKDNQIKHLRSLRYKVSKK